MASAANAQAIYARYQPWFKKYKGGVPAGFLAAIVDLESSGRVDAVGDPSLGEYGLLQVGTYTPQEFGLSPELRYDTERNIFFGALDIQQRAVRAYLAAPDVITLGSADFWCCGRLAAAVGNAGFRNLVNAARLAGDVSRGRVFEGIRDWANRTGAIALSSAQPASKVLARVNLVESTWQLGQLIDGGFDKPLRTPTPPGVTAYSLPAVVAPYFDTLITKKNLWRLALTAGALGAGYLVAQRLTQ